MTSFGEVSGNDQPELADVGRLARRLVHRAVRTARTEDQPLRRVLLDHLGPDAATLPTVSDTCPLYEQVNLQVGLDAWLAEPGREHEAIGLTGVQQMRFNDVTIGDLIQAAADTIYSRAGVGAPVATNLPCGPDGQTLPCALPAAVRRPDRALRRARPRPGHRQGHRRGARRHRRHPAAAGRRPGCRGFLPGTRPGVGAPPRRGAGFRLTGETRSLIHSIKRVDSGTWEPSGRG
jgi:hypothetical protein